MTTNINYNALCSMLEETLKKRFRICSLIKFDGETENSIKFSLVAIQHNPRVVGKISNIEIPKNIEIIQVLIYSVLKNYYTYIENKIPTNLCCQDQTIIDFGKHYQKLCKKCPHQSYCMAKHYTSILLLLYYRKPVDFKILDEIYKKYE